MIEIIAIITLAVLVLAQAVERYLYSKAMNKQLSDCTKAIMSRNINEYLAATNEPKKDSEFVEEENVDLDQASDEEFDKALGINDTKK